MRGWCCLESFEYPTGTMIDPMERASMRGISYQQDSLNLAIFCQKKEDNIDGLEENFLKIKNI